MKIKILSDSKDEDEARNLKKIYEDCLQRAENLEIFGDGQSQGLMQAVIEVEIKNDIKVQSDIDSSPSTLETDRVKDAGEN